MNKLLAGRHLVLDCKLTSDSLSIVSSREHMAQYLEDVTKITGMTLVFPPFALKFPFASETHRLTRDLNNEGLCKDSKILEEFNGHLERRDTEGSGVSAMSMWLESHSSLHAWTEQGYISIDLFSCKLYEIEPVLRHTKEFMRLETIYVTSLDRYMNSSPDVSSFEY